ncbi:hypothetical protein CRM22_003723 [Opisthorchis felineus]|uniref:EF-hand domain-containing protein n=1 Tax=Opisthorchis felineus TaxID=147828 RepID=A0A4S2LZY3_OPIFE|nr:hypothetical protein CRM22_003723 [Opisthorchis felineus]
MEPFLEAFFSIDTDHSERITMRELQDYVKRNNIDPSMIKRWQVLFDANDSGVITLDEFCKTLGIRPSEARAYNANMVRASHGPSLPREVDVITATLPFDQQVDIVSEVMRLTRSEPFDENLVSKQLKQYLDRQYGRMWHVVITKGSSWCSFSYEPKTSLFFQLRKYTYLAWKTPS